MNFSVKTPDPSLRVFPCRGNTGLVGRYKDEGGSDGNLHPAYKPRKGMSKRAEESNLGRGIMVSMAN